MIGLLVLGITAIGAVLLASTRRNLILMPIVIALAGVAVAWLAARLPVARGRTPTVPRSVGPRACSSPSVFPSELTALARRRIGRSPPRSPVFAIWRRRSLRNVDVLILLIARRRASRSSAAPS